MAFTGKGLSETVKISNLTGMLIDPCNECNFRCAVCPTGNRELIKKSGRSHGKMHFALFKKIIDDIAENASLKNIMLYNHGEPLLHPRLPEMVAYAKGKMPATRISLTTNGSLLSRKKSIALLEAGLDWLRVSFEGINDDDYREAAGTGISYNKIASNFRAFAELRAKKGMKKPYLVAQILKTERNINNAREFFDRWKGIADEIFLVNITSWDGTAGIRVPDFSPHAVQGTGRKPCYFLWQGFAVNFDGRAVACCTDWVPKNVIGDFRRQSVKEIWNSPEMARLRKEQLTGDFSNAACRDCTLWMDPFLKKEPLPFT